MDFWNKITARTTDGRKRLGLSYQSLAEKTGLTKSTLQRYEKGNIKNAPPSPGWKTCAEAWRCPWKSCWG